MIEGIVGRDFFFKDLSVQIRFIEICGIYVKAIIIFFNF